MGREYTDTLIAEPNIDWLSTTLSTVETTLWNPTRFTPIEKNTARPGKVWRLSTYGLWTGSPMPSALTFNFYYGTSPTDPAGGRIGEFNAIPPADVGSIGFVIDLKFAVRPLPFAGVGEVGVWGFGTMCTDSGKALFFLPAHTHIDPTVDSAITATMTLASGSGGVEVGTTILEALN